MFKLSEEKLLNAGMLVLRLVLAAIFITAGWAKLQGIEGVAEMFGGMGFPAPLFFAYLVGLVELVGGVGVLLGVYTRTWAALLAFIMLVALVLVHLGQGFQDSTYALSLFGGAVALLAAGPGAWKLSKKDCITQCFKKK